jgi:hypothetical protein
MRLLLGYKHQAPFDHALGVTQDRRQAQDRQGATGKTVLSFELTTISFLLIPNPFFFSLRFETQMSNRLS